MIPLKFIKRAGVTMLFRNVLGSVESVLRLCCGVATGRIFPDATGCHISYPAEDRLIVDTGRRAALHYVKDNAFISQQGVCEMRALALLSGGLDSTLAIKIVQDAGIDVVALNFTSPFCRCGGAKGCGHAASYMAEKLGVRLIIKGCGEEYLRIVERPRFGYGRHLNPCLDCRIYKFKEAKKMLPELGASFIVTGEVLGQRPNSQRRDAMAIIDRESGLRGMVLRPLSAAHLEPTIPEVEGWIDRSRLLGIKGRSRKIQMALAEEYGISDYPCPAGGCLLADEGFAAKVRDLIDHGIPLSTGAIARLKVGRHFRLGERAKGIVGKNREDNARLEALARPDDWLLTISGFQGPLSMGEGELSPADLQTLARLAARYSDAPPGAMVDVECRRAGAGETVQVLTVAALSETDVERYRVR